MNKCMLPFLMMALSFWGCKETIVEYRDNPTPSLPKVSDAYHGDIVGKIKQLGANAVVIVSQVGPIDSAAASQDD